MPCFTACFIFATSFFDIATAYIQAISVFRFIFAEYFYRRSIISIPINHKLLFIITLMTKKIFKWAVAATIVVALPMCVTSCSDKDDDDPAAVPEEEVLQDIDPVDQTPKEDALKSRTNVKAYVFEGAYGDIGTKLIARLTNRQQALDNTIQLIILPGGKYKTLSENEKKSISTAYKNGAVILVDRPSNSVKTSMTDSFTSGESTSSTPDNGTDNEEVEEIWGIKYPSHVLCVDIPLKDAKNTSAANRADLTDYEEGLFADETAKWVDTDHNAVAAARMQEATTRTNAQLSALLEAQTDTWVTNVSFTRDHFSDDMTNRTTPYTVTTTIYTVHKFDNNTDYFLIDQTLTGNNDTFWFGQWSKKSYQADWDSKKHNWNAQGYYANNWELENRVTRGGWEDYVKLSDGLSLFKHAPGSTNSSTSTSTTTSWNIGGNLGVSVGGGPSSGLSGGISGSVGSTQTLYDISTLDKCMEGETCNNNAWWLYKIDPWRQFKNGTFKYSFITPPEASIHTFSCEQSWLWELQNATNYSDLKLRIDFNMEINLSLVRNPFESYFGYEDDHYWKCRMVTINLPAHSLD